MLDRVPSVHLSRIAAYPHDLSVALSRVMGWYTPDEVASMLNRSACVCTGDIAPSRQQAILACATQPSEWWGRLDHGTEWKLGLRLYYRLPTIVSWYLAGLTPEEIGCRISMFGGSASALRALEAAARCIASRLNDHRLPPVRGAA
ncbi:MAG: hypothetical protein U0893_18605 [Chloroflexota bacterium]